MRLTVVGGGVSGLCIALLAARAGHAVTVVERDPPRSGDTPEHAWERWDRRGVPQFRQLHGYQALARTVLRERLPDVLDALHRAGAADAPLVAAVPGVSAVAGSEALVQVRCRRSTVEWVLRQAALNERGVEVREGTAVTGLLPSATHRQGVQAVRTGSGEIAADLVVDAAGRRSPTEQWCLAAGLPAAGRLSVDTGQVYFTRWFRARGPMPLSSPLRIELTFATLMVAPADAGWFSVTFFAPAADAGLRAVLLHPDRFVTAARAVAPAAPVLDGDVAEPEGDVLFMGRLSNHLRRSVPGAVVTGLVGLADAVACTNPTWGRGVALAMANAGALADLLGRTEDPALVSAEFDRIGGDQLEPWYHDTVALDAETNARWSVGGGSHAAGRGPDERAGHADAVAAARVDPVVFVAYSRYRNLLDPPSAFWANEEIDDRIRSAISAGAPPVALQTPSRAELLALA